MNDRLDQRLRERLAALDAAVPAEKPAKSPAADITRARLRPVRRGSQSTSARPLGLVAAVFSLLVIAVVAAVVAQRPTPTTGPGSQTGSPAATKVVATVTPTAAGLVTGADGIPTQMDGQPVHTMLDQSAWPANNDSFLLAAEPGISAMACPPGANLASPPYTSVEAEFLTGRCNYASLRPVGTGSSADAQWLAPKSPAFSQLFVWSMAGAPVLMRVHTHDSEAALCTRSRPSSTVSTCTAATR
jgi:hypothetical protein